VRQEPPADRAPEAPQYPGCELLRASRPRDVLARLTDGDPLGLRERCRERLRLRAVLVSENRLFLRSVARVAYASMTYRGTPALATWLRERIDQALRELLTEDYEADRVEEPQADDEDEERYAFLTDVLGVDTVVARRASVVFNSLPDPVRQAFWALVIEGKSINRHVAEGHGPGRRVRARVKRAILAISLLRDPGDPLDEEAP